MPRSTFRLPAALRSAWPAALVVLVPGRAETPVAVNAWPPTPRSSRITDLLGRMTPEEKIGQMFSNGWGVLFDEGEVSKGRVGMVSTVEEPGGDALSGEGQMQPLARRLAAGDPPDRGMVSRRNRRQTERHRARVR